MAFPVLGVVLANFLLYCADVGVDTRLVVRSDRAASGDVFYLNPLTDVAYSDLDLRGPEPRAFTLPHPPHTFRVVVVGASSVQGFPYPSELAFPRQLELLLGRQLPAERVEVLNAGIVGLSTAPLVDIVRQAVASRPDLVVVYAGHNEFYGIGGVAGQGRTSWLASQLRRYRLVQVLSKAMNGANESPGMLIERLPSDFSIPLQSDLVRRAAERYRQNLVAMVRTCARADVPLILCSTACNLKDQGPIRSCSPLTAAAAVRRDRLIASAVRLMARAQLEQAIQSIEEAERLDSGYAEIAYRKAQCLERLQRFREAAVAYSAARDLDACRYRAPASFRDIVRQVVSSSRSGVDYVDLVDCVARAAEHGVPGDELFLEHVHFNLEGHWLVAKSLAQRIVQDIRHQAWSESEVPSRAERDAWLGLVPQDHLVAATLSRFLCQTPPLADAADAQERLDVLAGRIKECTARLPGKEEDMFFALEPQTRMDDLVQGLGQLRLQRGETKEALELFEKAKRRRPWMPHSYIYAALCYHLLGDDKAARENIQQSYETIVQETDHLKRMRSQGEAALR